MTEIEQLIVDAQNSPECFKCKRPITEFDEVRIVAVRVEARLLNVWMHADYVNC